MVIAMPNKHARIILRKHYYFHRCKETLAPNMTRGTYTGDRDAQSSRTASKCRKENKNLFITTDRFLAPLLHPPPTNCIFRNLNLRFNSVSVSY
jgi:hypothetical protein